MFFSKKSKSKKIKDKLLSNLNFQFSLTDVFPDQNLAQVVAETLQISPKDKVDLNTLNRVESLNAVGRGISTLEGIEFLNGLKTANFSNNNISKLPDYTDTNPNLAKNKETLILMDLSNNPFLNPDNLFSLESSEQRRKFIEQFKDSYTRFKLGDVKDKLYTNTVINPAIIRMAINSLMPRDLQEDRNDQINNLFLKYLIGKKLFYNNEPYKDEFILTKGRLNFKTDLITPSYLNHESEGIIAQLLEEIIPKEDLYLIRSIINTNKPLIQIDSNNLEDYLTYYQSHPDELSVDYIRDKTGWKEKSSYTDLRNAALSNQEELLMQSIANPVIKKEYNRYIQLKDVLEQYQKDHPEKAQDVSKLINKNEDMINNFLNQYISLEKNTFLTDQQQKTLKKAEDSIITFNKNYMDQATSLFEQDIFGLEVEMKYIDMLAEANRKID